MSEKLLQHRPVLMHRLSAKTIASVLKNTLVVTASLYLFTLSTVSVAAEVEQITTPEGHKFWYYPMPRADRTALAIRWAQEVPYKTVNPAVARIGTDVMLNGGAAGREAADIVADYQDLDAGSGLWVQPRHVSGFIVAPDKHLSKAREIATQVITEPTLEERWFDREQQKLIEVALEDGSTSWGLGWNIARELVIGDHPYNEFWSERSLDEIEKLSLDDINQWFNSSFSQNTATVAVAGSAESDVVAKELDLLFANLPEDDVVEPITFPEPVVQGKTVLFHNPDAPKSVVILLGNLPASDQKINQPLQLGIGVLGFGQQSRLFKAVRSGIGATYGFGASMFNFTSEHRMLEMTGEIETAKLQQALNEIEEAYSEFRESGIGRIEFPLAKRVYKREVNKQIQNPVNVAFSVIDAMDHGFSDNYLETALKTIDAMGRSEANEVMQASLPEYDDLLKVIVSPDEKAVRGACVIRRIEEARNCLN